MESRISLKLGKCKSYMHLLRLVDIMFKELGVLDLFMNLFYCCVNDRDVFKFYEIQINKST